MDSDERERGILSSADREYALDPEKWSEDKSKPSVSQRKKAITSRVRNAILDFEYLVNENFPQEILDSAFQPPDDFDRKKDGPITLRQAGMIDLKEGTDPNIERGFTAAVCLIYRKFPLSVANNIIEKGVKRAVSDFYPNQQVIDASYDPVLISTEDAHKKAKDKLREGSRLTSEQVQLLLERGEVDPEEVAEHVQSNQTEYKNRLEKTHEETREQRRDRLSGNLDPEEESEK